MPHYPKGPWATNGPCALGKAPYSLLEWSHKINRLDKLCSGYSLLTVQQETCTPAYILASLPVCVHSTFCAKCLLYTGVYIVSQKSGLLQSWNLFIRVFLSVIHCAYYLGSKMSLCPHQPRLAHTQPCTGQQQPDDFLRTWCLGSRKGFAYSLLRVRREELCVDIVWGWISWLYRDFSELFFFNWRNPVDLQKIISNHGLVYFPTKICQLCIVAHLAQSICKSHRFL